MNYKILDTLYTPYETSIWYEKDGEVRVISTMAPIEITAKATNKRQNRAYTKLQKRVIKVYPYAKAAGDVMHMYEAMCMNITDEKEREKLLDQAEEEMKKNFERDLREMTVNEGIILIKLIDRETGNTSFSLVRELKGKLSAYMWQGVARLFGHNLKSEYDPTGDDIWIENTVVMIEDGVIPVQYRDVDPFGLRGVSAR
ncbi:MAG: DUF4294 domain-containing protein [Flavobacteriales bacterium]